MNSQAPEIFFHVGLGKVASTYLQYKVFPKLKGVQYIQRTQYSEAENIINQGKADKYLVSREFDRQLEDETTKFSSSFPNAKVIILFRRHDSWIASQYRRFVKNGFSGKFTDFMDIENDRGHWKRIDLEFFRKIETIEKHFDHQPLVLFHDDLKQEGYGFIDKLANYMGATYDPASISLHPKHTSYNEKQLKLMRRLGKYLFNKRPESSNKAVRTVQRYIKFATAYSIMFTATLLPDSWFAKESLIPREELNKIRKVYEEDWNKCVDYARQNNPEALKTGM